MTRSRVGSAGVVLAMTLAGVPALAQVDLSGTWANPEGEDWVERSPGPDPVDYLGLPINDQARTLALQYDAGQLSLLERQCSYYAPHYVVLGPFGLKIWNETDPVTGNTVAWKMGAWVDKDIVTIWMDGRPHPSKNAFHPFGGFTTGVWEGNTLTTYTTHIKRGWLRRNGVPSSDRLTLTQHLTRHGDILTITAIIDDPVFLTEPYVVTRSWRWNPDTNFPATPSACEPISELPVLENTSTVPHYLPGAHPFLNEFAQRYNLPMEAVLGGAHTMYPEYRKKLKDQYVAPKMCTRYCCGPGSPPGGKCITDGSGIAR